MPTYTIHQTVYAPWHEGDDDRSTVWNDEWNEPTLRNALDAVQATRTNLVGGTESIEVEKIYSGIIVRIVNSTEFETGCNEYRSLFIRGATRSTGKRIAALLRTRLEG